MPARSPDPGGRWWQARSFASTCEVELEWIRADVKRSRAGGARRWIAACAVGALPAALVAEMGLMACSGWPGWPYAGPWGLLSMVPGAAAGALFLAAWPRPGAAEVSARIARCRLCVGCGYSLDGLPSAPDGCTVCPECGAAWRLQAPTA